MTSFTTPEEYLQLHADNHPEAVIRRAYSLLGDWTGNRHSKLCAATAVYAGYLTSGWSDHPSVDEIAMEFGVSVDAVRESFENMSKE